MFPFFLNDFEISITKVRRSISSSINEYPRNFHTARKVENLKLRNKTVCLHLELLNGYQRCQLQVPHTKTS
ncbi:hypothetical protein WH47_03005 [Habropoda laboriosa]|uniref:Uncharacterized protein n=1 Tax=Habropoda laboriosa TaxID=597456 RepID=A0A0L7QSW9_9HYME|nr:hypothetical protein WH47_03005 [Habropoda laboriosa]